MTFAILHLVLGKVPVICEDLAIPTLEGWFPKAKVCCPESDGSGKRYPLQVHQHGDGGGGIFMWLNNKIYKEMASEGVCILGPYSCPVNTFCDSGFKNYLEILKSLVYVEDN